jgi:hypothetical protein
MPNNVCFLREHMPRRSDFFPNASWNLARMTNVWLPYICRDDSFKLLPKPIKVSVIIGQASDIMFGVGMEGETHV